MDRSLYIAMTGASQNMLAQAVHANNLANVSTTGFRGDMAQARAMPLFGEVYAGRVFAMTERPATDFTQGVINQTGNPLDVAVKGKGFIAVQAPNGQEAYTRAGDLKIDQDGMLRTGSGLPVLGNGGPITIPPAAKITLGGDGSITIQPLGAAAGTLATVDRIKVAEPDLKQMVKGEDGLLRDQRGQLLEASPTAGLEVGALEKSNVNAVAELTEILTLSRQFELSVKYMREAQTNDEAVARILQMT